MSAMLMQTQSAGPCKASALVEPSAHFRGRISRKPTKDGLAPAKRALPPLVRLRACAKMHPPSLIHAGGIELRRARNARLAWAVSDDTTVQVRGKQMHAVRRKK